MPLTRTWDITIPADTDLAGEGDDRITDLKTDIKEHVQQDHYMDNYLDPTVGNCDGHHRKATFSVLASDPTVPLNTSVIYAKLVDSIIELFCATNNGGTTTIYQMTENGVIRLNTLQNDIAGNNKSITNLNTLSATTVQGAHKSSDGSTGDTETVTFNEFLNYESSYSPPCTYWTIYYRVVTMVFKNGLLISKSVGSTLRKDIITGSY